MTGHSAMDMPSPGRRLLVTDPPCAGDSTRSRVGIPPRGPKSVGRQNVADAGHMRAANRKVNICTRGREIAGRIGRPALQCTTKASFRFVTRLNSVCEPLRCTAGVDLARDSGGPRRLRTARIPKPSALANGRYQVAIRNPLYVRRWADICRSRSITRARLTSAAVIPKTSLVAQPGVVSGNYVRVILD